MTKLTTAPRGKKGFTLVEILVVMVIVTFILATTAEVFSYSNAFFAKSNLQYNVQNEIRGALSVINKEVRSATDLQIMSLGDCESDISSGSSEYNYIYIKNGAIYLSKYDDSATPPRSTRIISGQNQTILSQDGFSKICSDNDYTLGIEFSAADASGIGGNRDYNTRIKFVLQNMKLLGGGITGTQDLAIRYAVDTSIFTTPTPSTENPKLDAIIIGGTILASFSPDVTDYSITLPLGTTELPSIAYVADTDYDVVRDPFFGGDPNGSVTLTVYNEDDSKSTTYTLDFFVSTSAGNEITYFGFSALELSYSDPTNNIVFTVPDGTAITSLTPTISVSAGATVSPASGTAQDYTLPVTYTVTAEDGSIQNYIVTVAIQSDITAPSVATLGSGTTYNIPKNESVTLSFSEPLLEASRIAVGNALIAGASGAPTITWDIHGKNLIIQGKQTGTGGTTYYSDITVSVSDEAGNSAMLTLIDAN